MGILRICLLVVIVLVGAGLGSFLAFQQIDHKPLNDTRNGAIIDDYWVTDLDIGATDASGLLRARIARRGLFALNRAEAIYFTRSVDDFGNPLRADCQYDIAGGPLPAEWWSITLYGQDNYLARNTDKAASLNGFDPRLNGPTWQAVIASSPVAETPWMSTNGVSQFDVTLRLYGPDLDMVTAPEYTGFPQITPRNCPEAPN